jgi:hypothetical protein
MRRLPAIAILAVAAALLSACQSQVAQPPPSEQQASAQQPSSPPSTIAPQPVPQPAGFVTGLNIPWAVGAMRYDRDGSIEYHPGDWPDFPVEAIRLWDTRTAWLNLEPANDRWDFRRLDRFVAKARANGTTDITLVLAGTPRWAAGRVSDDDAAWLGPGSASMPKQLAEWREFVTTVAAKYRGVITAYEIGNEPNLATFWSGTRRAYAAYIQTAAAAIRAADPAATIVAGGPVVRDITDLPVIEKWLGPVMARAGDDLDAVAVHLYPKATERGATAELVAATKGALDAVTGGLPAWVTEVNVTDGATLTRSQQAVTVTTLTTQIDDAGFERAYWYAWTDLGPEDLIQLWPGTAGARALSRQSTG